MVVMYNMLSIYIYIIKKYNLYIYIYPCVCLNSYISICHWYRIQLDFPALESQNCSSIFHSTPKQPKSGVEWMGFLDLRCCQAEAW